MDILIIGIGSLGGVFASRLLKTGYNCTLITNNDKITDAIKSNGIKILEDGKEEIIKSVPLTRLTEIEGRKQQFDLIIFLTKTYSIEKASQDTINLLKPSGSVLIFQNGNVYDIVNKHFNNKVISGVVGWGSTMISPGVYQVTSKGKLFIGELSNSNNGKINEISEILSCISPTVISSNILGVIWSKLAINCTINAIGGISGFTVGEMAKTSNGRFLFLQIYREVVETAELLNIKLERIVNDPYKLYLASNSGIIKRYYKDLIVRIVGKKFKSVRPSLLQDLDKKRLTEIDFINGYVSGQAELINHLVPYNNTLISMIREIEKNLDENEHYFGPHPRNILVAISKVKNILL